MIPLELKAARIRCGYTQKDVADYLGISVPSYQKKESGVVKISEAEKFQIGRFFGFDLGQLDMILFDGQLKTFEVGSLKAEAR